MNLVIFNPKNGRSTDYDARYLKTEARMAAKRAQGRLSRWYLRAVDGQGVALVVHYTSGAGLEQSVSVRL